MIAAPQPANFTVEAYFQLEEASAIKHEYRAGEVYAMAGANDAHVTITGNLFAQLRSHVRGSDCRVYFTDMKARIENCSCYYYPDVMVSCDLRDRKTSTYKCFPKLIIEVLSDSTEAFDRGDKFADYMTLDSLEEYVLISTKKARIDIFRRGDDGQWKLQFYTSDQQTFRLDSIDFVGTMVSLYEDVVWENRQ